MLAGHTFAAFNGRLIGQFVLTSKRKDEHFLENHIIDWSVI